MFFVISDDCKCTVSRLVDIFEDENVNECKVIEWFILVICIDIMGKDIDLFESIREILTYVDGYEDWYIVHEQDGSSIDNFIFRDESDDEFLGWSRDGLMNEGLIY